MYTVWPAGGGGAFAPPAQRYKRRRGNKRVSFLLQSSNMAAAWRLKRVAASQPGFLNLKSEAPPPSTRRKRVNKNKKKNWNKHIDVNDVEDFLEDVRHQERTTGWAVQKTCLLGATTNVKLS